MITCNQELLDILAAATTKLDWYAVLEAAMPSPRRVVCARNSVTFRDCALTGSMTNNVTSLTGLGFTSGTTTALAADLSSGSSTLSITGGGHNITGTLGLTGSGCDFIMSTNPTTGNGIALNTVAINAPSALPDGLPDTTPPTVSIAVSTANVTASPLTLTATVSDDTAVTSVEFYRGATLLGTVSSSPWTFDVTLGHANNGSYTFTAKAFDAAGNNATSSPSSTVTVNIADPGGLLATMTLVNTSGSQVAANHIPPMFGHPFKKGDIPYGSYPRFELADTTTVPYSWGNQRTWSDGSLKFASFMIRVPTTIASNGTLDISVKSDTVAPSASSRTTADLSSGSADLNVTVVGLDNLSGTWVSSLNQGVTDNDDTLTFLDGPAGKVWRIRQQFMQSAANHGQLECYWYVAALQNASSGLYGLRYLGRVVQPWYNVDSPTKNYRSFSSFLLKNGASTVRDCWANHSSTIPFSYTSAGNTYSRLDATAHGLETSYLVRATGTTLPTGMSASTSYFVNRVDANKLDIYDNPSIATGQDSGNIALSGTASGDAAFSAYPFVPHFASLWTCGATAKWDYLQAGGTVSADATVRIQHDKTYLKSTGALPPYDMSITPSTQTSYNYELGTMGPINRHFGDTGERADLGLMPGWHAMHFMSQRATDEQVVRVTGLACGHMSIALYNATNKTVPVVNNGSYSGMPTANSNFRWRGNANNSSGFTDPTNTNVCLVVQDLDFDHMPCLPYYPYVLTGEPQYLDMIIEMAVQAVSHRYSGTATSSSTGIGYERNGTTNGTNYYGTVIGNSDSLREDAWSMRELGVAAALVPDSAVQCASYKSYFNDMNAATYAKLADYRANVAPAFWRSSGMIHFRQNGGAQILDNWMIGYHLMTIAQVAKMTEDTNALAEASQAAKWFKTIRDNLGAWHIPSYEATGRVAEASGSAYISDINDLGSYVEGFSWSSGNQTFTWTHSASQNNRWVPANGDKIKWDQDNGNAPGGLSNYTWYYVINAYGTTFKLSATLGGSAITPSDTNGGSTAFIISTNQPTHYSVQGDTVATSYMSNILGALRLANAAGATVDSALIIDLDDRVTFENVSYADEPKYKFASTY